MLHALSSHPQTTVHTTSTQRTSWSVRRECRLWASSGGGSAWGRELGSTPGLLSPTLLFHLHRWVSVLQNSKDEALSSAFNGEPSGGQWSWGGTPRLDAEPQDLTKMLIAEVKSRPGNGHCCDCGAAGEWWGRFGGRCGEGALGCRL